MSASALGQPIHIWSPAETPLSLYREDPPVVSSGPELQQWMCRVHNEVNKGLGRPQFNCKFVDSRWGTLECGDELSCDMQGARAAAQKALPYR